MIYTPLICFVLTEMSISDLLVPNNYQLYVKKVPCYASRQVTGNGAATTIAVAGTPVPADWTGNVASVTSDWVAAAAPSTRLTYQGAVNGTFLINLSIAGSPTAGPKNVFHTILKDGAPLSAVIESYQEATSQYSVVSLSQVVEISYGSYIEVGVGNASDATSVIDRTGMITITCI